MPKKLTIRLIIILIFIFLFSGSIYSQVVVKGIVRDSLSNEPLSYVSVYFKNTVDGDVTANDGTFSVMSRNKSRTVVFSMVGYKDKVVHLKKDLKNHNLKILLAPTTYDLKEVVVKPKKEKYSNKNNPAVDFVMEPFARYWHIQDSDVSCTVDTCGLEPKNRTWEFGIRAGVRF